LALETPQQQQESALADQGRSDKQLPMSATDTWSQLVTTTVVHFSELRDDYLAYLSRTITPPGNSDTDFCFFPHARVNVCASGNLAQP